MLTTRKARLESVLKEETAKIFATLKDPRIQIGLTITQIDLSHDGSWAKIYLSFFHPSLSEAQTTQALEKALEALSHAQGYIRSHLAKHLRLRIIPQLQFLKDKGLENTAKMHVLFQKIKEEKTTFPEQEDSTYLPKRNPTL